MADSILYSVYNSLGYVATPILHWLFARRVAQGKEVVERKGERFGISQQSRPPGSLMWFHAASVGETNSVLPLIKSYAEQDISILFTSGTVTSANIAQDNLPKGVIHQFVPYDIKPIVKRFLEAWKPSVAIFVESEIWPAMLDELQTRQIPSFLVNGRMSESSYKSWRKIRGMSNSLFSNIDLCFAQSDIDTERFSNLGVPRVESIGNLKFEIEPLSYNENLYNEIVNQVKNRPRWLAVSTHEGEEELIIAAHQLLKEKFPELLTIILPRHPKRGPEILKLCEASKLNANIRSKQRTIDNTNEIHIADTLGEVGLFCRLSDIVFLGGSFVNLGGHNPIEPAQLNCAILTGPNIDNNKRIFEAFFKVNASLLVKNTDELVAIVHDLLESPDRVAELATNAKETVEFGRGALTRTKSMLDTEMKKLNCLSKKET